MLYGRYSSVCYRLDVLCRPNYHIYPQTCAYICDITRDKALWLSLLRVQSRRLPLHIPKSNRTLSDLQPTEIERLVLSAHHIDRTWLLPRQGLISPYLSSKSSLGSCSDNVSGDFRSISSMDIFFDRWLVCIYCEGIVELWDLQINLLFPETGHSSRPQLSPKLLLRQLLRSNILCLSSVMSLDEDQDSVVLMIVL